MPVNVSLTTYLSPNGRSYLLVQDQFGKKRGDKKKKNAEFDFIIYFKMNYFLDHRVQEMR